MEQFRKELNHEITQATGKPVIDNEIARANYIDQVHPGYGHGYAAPYGGYPHAGAYYGGYARGARYGAGYPLHPAGYFGGIVPARRATSPQPRLGKLGAQRTGGKGIVI